MTPRLAALVRKALIRPDRAQLAGEDGFRFRHLLIRDAAYDALPKATRADLHERFATWLEQHGTELVELDEILGYHLEQACRYRAELGTPDDGILAAAARRRLTAAGRRAQPFGQDYRAAVSLFERAAALVPPAELDLVLETELIDALFWAGNGQRRDAARGLPRRACVCGRAIVSPSSAGGSKGACTASPSSRRARRRSCPRSSSRRCPCSRPPATTWLCTSPTPRLRRWRPCAGRWGQGWRPSSGPSPTLGRRATYRLSPVRLAPMLASSARLPCRNCSRGSTRTSHEQGVTTGSVPTGPGRWRCSVASTRRARSSPKRVRSWRSAAGESCSRTSPPLSVWVELWADDPAAAAEFGAAELGLFEELGELGFLSTAAGHVAQALYALDRLDEADAWAARAIQLGASDDTVTQMLSRQVRAKVLARRGEHAEAERLAREAVAIGAGTDALNWQGDANADLGEVLLLGGKADGAAPRSSRPSTATSARETSSWPGGRATGWRLQRPRHPAPRDWASRVRAPSAAFFAQPSRFPRDRRGQNLDRLTECRPRRADPAETHADTSCLRPQNGGLVPCRLVWRPGRL